MKIIVTGVAGFIGSHLAEKLLILNHEIIGIDNLNNYYSIKHKHKNLDILYKYDNFIFIKEDITNSKCINIYNPDIVIHLASMAGVRNSIENPILYAHTNINSQINLLQQCINTNIKYIYASSSSVYGLNDTHIFNETDIINKCNSPYATSKYCMEQYSKLYRQIYNINSIGLRFFTVYGPRGRPDMAPFKFLYSINSNNPITKYGNGDTSRDYTYIDDIIDGIVNLINTTNNNLSEIYNLGNTKPIKLNTFIDICSKVVGKKPIVNHLENQDGDVPFTCANIKLAQTDFNYNPTISLEKGLLNTFNWIKTLENN